MTQFETNLINALADIKGSGSFLSADNQPLVFPGLEIKGMDEVAFPLNTFTDKRTNQIRSQSSVLGRVQRPFWTLPSAVRGKLDASEISFNNPDWKKFIAKITEDS
ncbi:MAG: hypothetical protein U5N85_01870 [Arcicella sp.]|nr:hypothetical protein [Arcicella sp.]